MGGGGNPSHFLPPPHPHTSTAITIYHHGHVASVGASSKRNKSSARRRARAPTHTHTHSRRTGRGCWSCGDVTGFSDSNMQQVERKRTKLTSRQQHQRASDRKWRESSGTTSRYKPPQPHPPPPPRTRKNRLTGGESYRVWTAGSCRRCWEWLAPPTPVYSLPGQPIRAQVVDISPPEDPHACLCWEKLERLELPAFPQLPASSGPIHMVMSWRREAARAPARDNTSLFPGSGMNQSSSQSGGGRCPGPRLGDWEASAQFPVCPSEACHSTVAAGQRRKVSLHPSGGEKFHRTQGPFTPGIH